MICFYSSLSHKREMFICGDEAVVLTTRRQFDWLQSQLSVLPLGKLWTSSPHQKVYRDFN